MKRLLLIFMRVWFVRLLLLAGAATLLSSARAWASQPACTPMQIEGNIEVTGREITLADLLSSSTCPNLRSAAAEVRLGRVPLEGTERVLDGVEVRTLLLEHARNQGWDEAATALATVPDRITIRRAGARMSCVQLARRILDGVSGKTTVSFASELAPEVSLKDVALTDGWSKNIECGAADRIREGAPIQATRSYWHAAQESWEISARCVRPADCVPFSVRIHGFDPHGFDPHGLDARDHAIASLLRLQRSAPPVPAALGADAAALVRVGETATLLWEQNGIRLQVPAVCLSPGVLGETIRARIQPGRRTLQATVTGPAMLRATP